MVTKSLICQLVETQVVRYLAGEALSDEALRQLDDHIGGCPECRSFLEAKKAELTSALRPTATPLKNPRERVLQAIVDARRLDEPAPARLRAASASAPASPPGDSAPKTVRPANLQWKPLVLSVALALVLVAMSALTSNPATVFGRKASEALASRAAPPVSAPSETQAAANESDPTPPSETAESSTTAPNPGDPDFVGPAAPAPGESDAIAETRTVEPNLGEAKPAGGDPMESSYRNAPPRVAVRSRPRAPRVRARRSPAPRPAPSQPTIRVYDANGKPL